LRCTPYPAHRATHREEPSRAIKPCEAIGKPEAQVATYHACVARTCQRPVSLRAKQSGDSTHLGTRHSCYWNWRSSPSPLGLVGNGRANDGDTGQQTPAKIPHGGWSFLAPPAPRQLSLQSRDAAGPLSRRRARRH
jgi:hypothetical protein